MDAVLDPTLEPTFDTANGDTGFPSSINPRTVCPVFRERGECRHGFKCRFLGGHVKKGEDGTLQLLKDEARITASTDTAVERNFLPGEALKQLRTKKVSTFVLFRAV